VKKSTFFLLAALFCAAIPAYAVKYVAVVETDVDAASGASSELTSAEVRLVTAALRDEATKNLPRDKYNVMTSETVQSMGGAVLEECSEENCVVALGSKIGADYIVRGTVSKVQAMFTLTIEMYETDNGTLVVSSNSVRSENAADLLEKAGEASAVMYKAFINAPSPTVKPAPRAFVPTPTNRAEAAPASAPQKPTKARVGIAIGLDAVGAGVLAYGLYEEYNVKKIIDNGQYKDPAEYESTKKAARNRNVGYVVGSVLLLTGISVHIFF